MTNVLVCDDDAMLRSVIGQMLREVGMTMTAEAEDADQALEQVLATDPEMLILDLALRSGQGEHLLQRLRNERPRCRVVIFSAYVADPNSLLDAGAAAVVDKPDFERLEEVLRGLASGGNKIDLRRSPARTLPTLPSPTGLTMSGFEPWTSLRASVDHLTVGDAVIVFDVHPTGAQVGVWDSVYSADFRQAVARAAVMTGRTQDRVSIDPDTGLPVMLIVAGHLEAPTAVFDRISAHWDREVATGLPVAAFGHVTPGREAGEILDHALARVVGASFGVDHPLAIV